MNQYDNNSKGWNIHGAHARQGEFGHFLAEMTLDSRMLSNPERIQSIKPFAASPVDRGSFQPAFGF
jgi:hypothetical protein